MTLGFLAMIVANGATVLGARSLLGSIKVGKPSVDFLLFLLIRLLLISVVVLAFGAAHGLTPLALGVAGVVALAALLACGAQQGLLALPRPSIDRWIFALAALILLRLLLQVWFFAPYVGDALSYHLPKVAEWVRAGAITRETGMDPRSAFPAGFELIEVWWTVFLRHDVLIEMAGLEFLAVAGAAATAIAREFGWSEKASAIAALFFTMTPGLQLQSTACVNDGPVAALVVATAALLVAKVHPVLLAVPLGLGLGIKPTMLYTLPGLAALAGMVRLDWGRGRRAAIAFAATALGVGAVWYVRNWILYGSPSYPFGADGVMTDASGATLQRLGPSFRHLRENLGSFIDVQVYDRNKPGDPMGSGNFNWGAAAFALGAPAFVALVRSEVGLRRLAVGLAISTLGVFTCVELDPWYTRFVLFLPLVPSLALARLWERHGGVAVLGSLALALGFLSTCVPSLLTRDDLRRMADQSWHERAFRPPPLVPDESGAVGYLCDDFGSGYSLFGPAFETRVVYLREGTSDAMRARLDAEQIGVVYVDGILRKRRALLDEGVKRGWLEPCRRDGWQGYVVRRPR